MIPNIGDAEAIHFPETPLTFEEAFEQWWNLCGVRQMRSDLTEEQHNQAKAIMAACFLGGAGWAAALPPVIAKAEVGRMTHEFTKNHGTDSLAE